MLTTVSIASIYCQLLMIWDQNSMEQLLMLAESIGKINSEQNPQLRDRFTLTTYPTIIILFKGKLYEYKEERTFEGIFNFVTNDFLLQKGELIPMEVSLLRLFNKSFGKMFIVFIFICATFFILFLLCKKMNKEEDEDTLLNISDDDSDDQHDKKD